MSLLKQDTIRRRRVDEITIELNEGNSKKYEVEAICNSAVYASKSEGHLPGLYYLVSWKSYPKEENTWEPALAVLHFCKLISTFHRDYPEKPTATSLPKDSTPPIAGLTIKPKVKASSTKQKRG